MVRTTVIAIQVVFVGIGAMFGIAAIGLTLARLIAWL